MTIETRNGLFDRVRALLRDRTLLLKATSFACIGAVNTVVDFGVFSLAYLYLGLPIIVANVLSWGVAVSGSYVMNSLITFAAESQRKLRAKAYAGFVGSQVRGPCRQHGAGRPGLVCHAGPDCQGADHRRELPGELLAQPFSPVPLAWTEGLAPRLSPAARGLE